MRFINRFSHLAILPVLSFLVSCGPVLTTSTILRWEELDKDIVRELGYLSVEKVKLDLDRLPPAIMVKVPKLITTKGEIKYQADSKGNLVMEDTPVFPQGTVFYGINITNKTDHVIRLTTAVIRLFDPAGTDYSPLDKDDLRALWDDYFDPAAPLVTMDRTSNSRLKKKINMLKLITPRVELLPNLPYKGYIAFQPDDVKLTGTWKISLYDIPVEVDAAGRVTKTVMTEFRTHLEKWIYTYEAENMFAKPELKSKEKIEE